MATRGRPAGEVRRLIVQTLSDRGGLALCDLAAATQVGYAACRLAVSNAMRAEQLAIVGYEKRAHCKQWVALYDVARALPEGCDQPGALRLQGALREWHGNAVVDKFSL